MLKKLLAIAMIGTAMTASAEVPMEFRDGLITSPDFGGHFFSYYDEATGVTTFKSVSAATTYADVLKYCAEELNNAQLSNLDVEPWKDLGGGMDENGFWKNNIADLTAGPRYARTKKPGAGNTWTSLGYTPEHKFMSFEYKVNKALSSGATIFWQEGIEGGPTSPAEFALTVSDEWQTATFQVTPPDVWTTMENNGYMWIVFNEWMNSQDEIVLEVKNLALHTPEEVGIEPEPALPGTEPGEVEAPVHFTFNVLGGFTKETNSWGDPYFLTGGATANPLLASQTFIGTIPATASILKFDYKTSEPFKFVLYACQPTSNPDPRIPGGLTPLAIVDLEAYYDYGMIEEPEAEWNHVEIDMINFDKMPGVYKGDFEKAKFAQTPNSGDALWIQAQGFVPDTEFYIKDLRFENDPAGVQGIGIDEESEVVSSEFFDLQGRQLKAAPESGLYLRRDLRANGTSTTVKAIR